MKGSLSTTMDAPFEAPSPHYWLHGHGEISGNIERVIAEYQRKKTCRALYLLLLSIDYRGIQCLTAISFVLVLSEDVKR